MNNYNEKVTEETSEIKTVAESAKGVYVHKFKKPFEYEGKKYETLNFYFERLTGEDMVNAEAEMMANNEFALAAETSRSYQCRLAGKAGNIGSDVLIKMPLPDFNKITNAVRNFLLDLG